MQSPEDVTTNLVERLDGRFARRDESRIARRLWKKQAVDAISSLEEGAILDEFVHCLDEVGVLPRWQALQGDGIQREMVDFFQYAMLYGMQTLLGIEAMNALPALLFTDRKNKRPFTPSPRPRAPQRPRRRPRLTQSYDVPPGAPRQPHRRAPEQV